MRISFANIEEYLVTKAAIVALSQCTSSNGFTDFDAISFLLESIDGFWPQETDIDWRPLLATLLQALGDLRCDNNEAALVDLVTRRLFQTLSEYLKKHMVLDSTNYCVAESCLLGLVSLTCNDMCPREIVQGYDTLLPPMDCFPLYISPMKMKSLSFYNIVGSLRYWWNSATGGTCLQKSPWLASGQQLGSEPPGRDMNVHFCGVWRYWTPMIALARSVSESHGKSLQSPCDQLQCLFNCLTKSGMHS